jgi:hypothetical protein
MPENDKMFLSLEPPGSFLDTLHRCMRKSCVWVVCAEMMSGVVCIG